MGISCAGDRPLREGESYPGLMVFAVGDLDNGRKIKPGYLLIVTNSKLANISSNEGQVHGKLVKWFFGVEPTEAHRRGAKIVGFSMGMKDGRYQFRSTSRSLNMSHHGSADLSEMQDWYVRMALVKWAWRNYSVAAEDRNFSLRDLHYFYDTVG